MSKMLRIDRVVGFHGRRKFVDRPLEFASELIAKAGVRSAFSNEYGDEDGPKPSHGLLIHEVDRCTLEVLYPIWELGIPLFQTFLTCTFPQASWSGNIVEPIRRGRSTPHLQTR